MQQPERPLRTLNINRGIIAHTSTNQTFSLLLPGPPKKAEDMCKPQKVYTTIPTIFTFETRDVVRTYVIPSHLLPNR